MNNVISSKDTHNHTLVFTGKGGKYFVICLVNFLLTCITLGIYAPVGDGEMSTLYLY
ncbi:Inner membrane protein yjgN ORF X [Salmonella enterica subsp. enterica serovar Madelia]|nr:Inner membrane protein yjgN ORF X [Salmonella enterica subsp. enterica serovar Madelia]